MTLTHKDMEEEVLANRRYRDMVWQTYLIMLQRDDLDHEETLDAAECAVDEFLKWEKEQLGVDDE